MGFHRLRLDLLVSLWFFSITTYIMNEYDALILHKAKITVIDQQASCAEAGITVNLFV